ncbi:MAG: hypothetical protein JXR63_08085 [Spirochaetales bacterium]|nr:hypothetical protein [Spirochaetales bacterium]
MKGIIDFIKRKIKLISICVGLSFVIFFLVGLIGPVSFGRVIFRSLFYSVVMFFASAGFIFLWEKFIAEEDDQSSESSEGINIILDDDLQDDQELDLNFGKADSLDVDSDDLADPHDKGRDEGDDSSSSDAGPGMFAVGDEDDPDVIHSESLPEIDSLQGSFDDIEGGESKSDFDEELGSFSSSRGSSSSSYSSSSSSSLANQISDEIKASDFSNEEYAKVVRTVLKKDK